MLAARKAEGQEANEDSLLHRLDLALRRRISQRIAATTGDQDRRTLLQRCSEARKAAMAACRDACRVGQGHTDDAPSVDTFVAVYEQFLNASIENI